MGCSGARTARAQNVHFFSSQHALFVSFASMSEHSSFDDDLDQIGFRRPPSIGSNAVSRLGSEDVDSQCKSRPPLRSRPDIDFSRYSTTGRDLGFHSLARQTSYVSGSTLGSGVDPSGTPFSSHKPYFSTDSPPVLPSEIVALLPVSQLFQNPHYRLLQQKYDNVCEILIARDLAESRATQSDTVVPEMHQGV